MKKSNLAIGILYVLFGIVCLLTGLLVNTRLDSLLFGFAGVGIFPGCTMIFKYFYWTSPEHEKEYLEKMENEQIELQDELKQHLRAKAGQYTYVLGMVVIAVSMPVFAALDELQLFAINNLMFIAFLFLYLMFQIFAGNIIYKHLLKKYQ